MVLKVQLIKIEIVLFLIEVNVAGEVLVQTISLFY